MKKKLTVVLIRKLCEELNNQGIAYCHWKSNAMLDRSESGDNDLDLLVRREDVQIFTKILYELGFKKANSRPINKIPGILNYYGYDQKADKLVHVHAHFMLIIGHDATKNYHLPIEKQYLDSAVQDGFFKVPAPEFEIIVFVIRMVLKHSTWDVIFSGQGTLSKGECNELEYLENHVSRKKIENILKMYFSWIDINLFDSCIRALKSNYPIWFRINVGQKLHKNIKAFSRRPKSLDIWLKIWRRIVCSIGKRLFGNNQKKYLENGGLMVGIVGGDGAGKTTAVNQLYSWLSPRFATIKVHMGKPNWSLTTVLIRGLLKIGRSVRLYPFERGSFQMDNSDSNLFPGYPWLLRSVCTARDRYLVYAKARRYVSNGGIVISDRLPLPGVIKMDGPRFFRLSKIHKEKMLLKLLMRLEMKYYNQILKPEILAILKIDPEIAVMRKTDENETFVRNRSLEIWENDFQNLPAYIIDASKSKKEVIINLKSLIWQKL